MRISENFTLEELCKTSTGFVNKPNAEEVRNLVRLVTCILQPLRNAYGKPIYVNSGFRSAAVNKAVGGAAASQHLRGEAADITTLCRDDDFDNDEDFRYRANNKRLFELIISSELPFDQLIDEHNYQWIHVSYSPRNRRQVLHL